ncbi:MAG: cell filamentation protein Fic [Sulfurimonas sp. RIFCSPHIGHO2_12_FULL_36_9]|uniref:virulence RhuM family protein n=1 Tax=Sulfurimonas sp. RIFCSPLOWO2_12_36_12 TaxID=1802253 RepID=UPI0008AE4649|nr:virulence RhuM family protein [Sulfurimonas sp. RIFCSPLOWO2_12_36_12]OHD99007.1 MAG: cell filamentation protein Fic [Sulfurimonas sp. RIFCSPLOWO2_02_FULL_36_28]OHD99889.1 MAG: cell filamentation protein Fic [Sulfurimonas sp. RIFCSPHIGHO2_12_FULL_36_9]OHE01292.1 MAG: cell filamentation protein Fic [Sulfurimonas sp. RIFCSPLOWO2_12_36_12]
MDKLIRNSTAEFLIFTSQSGENSIEVKVFDESVWLTQAMIAQLFDTTKQNVSLHIKNIFESGELDENSVVKDFLTTANDGKTYNTKHYNLDAIISVGYRVNSKKATQFRQWATSVLKEFAIKGFVLDKKRLENGAFLGQNYFDKLLEEIREIRLSERMFYQKITDIYVTSVDYNKNDATTKKFFAKVQNKLHFAIHGHTAAELIYNRAGSTKEYMGLSTWDNAPDGKILRADVTIAKNYLSKDELETLGRIVNAFLDLAENRAKRNIPMTMEDWAKRLDAFLEFDDREILQDAGKITKKIADEYALGEFEKYRVTQDRLFMNDFDKLLLDMKTDEDESE